MMLGLGMVFLLFGCGTSSSSNSALDGDADSDNRVVTITPIDGEIDVPITKTIAFTCEEDVVLDDVSGVTLVGNAGEISVTVTSEGPTLFIDPVPLLEKNREYTVTLPAGTVVGVEEDVSLSFRTIQIEFDEQVGIVVSDVANASIGLSDLSSNMIVDESGVIHVVWKVPNVMTNPPGPQDGIYYSRSIDGGESFEPSVKIRDAEGLPTGSRSYIDPEITCSGLDNVYIAYPTANNQMEVVRSTNSGANPSLSERLGPCLSTSTSLPLERMFTSHRMTAIYPNLLL